MLEVPMGVANSISANFDFDPLDTLQFALQGDYEIVQIYLSEKLLNTPPTLKKLKNGLKPFKKVVFHAEGMLNGDFFESAYRRKLYEFLGEIPEPNFIIHFDERENIDTLIKLVEALSAEPPNPRLYIENFYLAPGKVAAEKNFKKYLALFTLSSNFGHTVYPVFDIPRVFHEKLELAEAESLEWCFQTLNFFGNRKIPLLLHLIDAQQPGQSRHDFCALGEGYIPYEKIFRFMMKTRPRIAGAIFEFEDKINPLKSREYILKTLNGKSRGGA